MKKKTFILFTLYTWCRILYGLILHPYKTVREIVRKPVFVPVIASPLVAIVVVLLLGKIGALFIDVYGLQRSVVAVLICTLLLAIFLWQLYIVYLLVSLISAKRKA